MLVEIKRRTRLIAKLNRKRAVLLAKVADVEHEIKSRGGEIKSVGVPGKRGARPRNAASLPDSMAEVMSKDKPMNVNQIASAVTAKGYRSTSVTFHTIIFQALAKDKRFKKVARGMYALK